MSAAGDPAGLQDAAGAQQRPAVPDRPAQLVAVVTRLVVAQATLSTAISVFFRGRNVPWTAFTVLLAIALCCLAAVVRSGSHTAWVIAISFEAAFAAVGLYRFVTARFLGGTLFALIALGILAHPAVIRAFGGRASRGASLDGRGLADPPAGQLSQPAPGPLEGRVAG
jgi:hypothetical protein